ncbi:MAG: gliding motility-associated ABC transporter permease subunit GldF [bacterium]|uniref:Gliding motility-associated ABC transporter permease subunit GldF n=1 Tax=Candidatus Aphodosoma intestinipullorum TaxID=2840674 RepID=A0A940DLC3_9BACT|nr:gliding motility-associated ABC transporter permease subunit GldF [Candidatus Aphodosoma intestinipullorum]
MMNICVKELKTFFGSATGYVVIALFLLGTALFLWVFPGQYNVLDGGYATLDSLFVLAPWLYLFLCPAISMRLFAEERQSGTLELLLTKPIPKWKIVTGKALAGWLLVIVALLPTLVWYYSVNMLADPAGNVDSGAFWGSFIGLILLAAVYVSIGVFSSGVSANQIVAFILGAVLCFAMFYGFELAGSLLSDGESQYAMRAAGINAHYKSLSRGVIDSRDIVYFVAMSALWLWLSKLTLDRKKI